jgi:hypothetical protein
MNRLNRLGRGDSYEALRAKILFTEGVCKVKKPKVQRPVQRADETGVFNHLLYVLKNGSINEKAQRLEK